VDAESSVVELFEVVLPKQVIRWTPKFLNPLPCHGVRMTLDKSLAPKSWMLSESEGYGGLVFRALCSAIFIRIGAKTLSEALRRPKVNAVVK
jgi:hypothetical protein